MAEATEIQMHEEFYIGSEGDSNEEQIVIPKQELRRLHDDIVSLSLVVANDWHGRIQPLKADYGVLKKLTMSTLNWYFASHNKKPHQHQQPTLRGFIGELYRQKLGV